MKTNQFQKMFSIMVVAALALPAAMLRAQPAANNAAPQAAPAAPAPELSYGAVQILRLMQAKVGDDTIIAYIKNSGTGYALGADQIIYLRQQGVSDPVINAMLAQPRAALASTPPSPPPSASVQQTQNGSTVTTESGSTATVAPVVTYLPSTPAPDYYYPQPYYYPYYPDYYLYPPVSFSFGIGGVWGGGFRGGGFRGGGFHR
jgi:hypothetical protein